MDRQKKPPGSTAMQPDGYGDCVSITLPLYPNREILSRGEERENDTE